MTGKNPMSGYWLLSSPDTAKNDYVFREDGSSGELVSRQEFRQSTCRKCGKIDEIASLSLLEDHQFQFPSRDLFFSIDWQLIIGESVKEIFELSAGAELEFVPIAANAIKRYIVVPKVLIPVEDPSAYTITSRCGACGRFYEAIWGSSIPNVPAFDNIAAFKMENRIGLHFAWILTDAYAKWLKKVKPRIRGLEFVRF